MATQSPADALTTKVEWPTEIEPLPLIRLGELAGMLYLRPRGQEVIQRTLGIL